MEPVNDQRIYSNRYQLTHLIARGGMAMVYRAHDLLLNRFVALKILYPELSVDHSFVERFRREAQAAANLSHPNIVPIFDWGEEDGTYFIVMELIEGTSLAELLSESRTLSPAKSAQVCAQVASALSYAHRQGVVHRDVKPGNILLTTDGQVKVTDFGIAQAISTEDNLTVAGSVMGTATYFSPEQAEGALVDGRSDVYSLGVVLYELLAGRPPFIGESPVAVASKHVREVTPSPRQFNPSLPTDLEAVTLHALAKRPEDRYQTADEFRADLLRFSEGQPVSVAGRRAVMGDDITTAVAAVGATGERTQAVPIMSGPRTDVTRRKRNVLPWIGALLLLLLAGGGAVAYALTMNHNLTRMPDVVGKDIVSATNELQNGGLAVKSTTVASGLAVNTVVSTDPVKNSKVTAGEQILLFVSSGTPATVVSVPNLIGQQIGTATSALTALSLTEKIVTTSTLQGNFYPGQVMQESPPALQKVNTGTQVTLYVLSSTAEYYLPDVTGMSQTSAAATLGGAFLGVSPTQGSTCSNTIATGRVVATSPGKGQLVTEGKIVQLIISTGVCQVLVPGVTTDTMSEATSVLHTAGLQGDFVPDSSGNCTANFDYVFSQDPTNGTKVPFGSSVTLDYCPPLLPTTTTTTAPG